jgi:hypothetical protein
MYYVFVKLPRETRGDVIFNHRNSRACKRHIEENYTIINKNRRQLRS